MSKDLAISLCGVGKMYRLYSSRLDNFLDALGINRLMLGRQACYREFWALREINLDLERGQRLGIIGRNGAGKSTLLKLITGNLATTEGSLHTNGQVRALMSTGAGFHPEFTGRENIVASLIYSGLTPDCIAAAIDEIADFTELGEFLDQPFKTYSSGMQARLTFAAATTIKPDILIIDEVLGAGDGYFIAKSSERMLRLVEENNATVLLVSHAMDQILRFCDRAIWLERGRIIDRGPSMEVVKAYQQHIQVLENRRLKAKNRKAQSGKYDREELDRFSSTIIVRLVYEAVNRSPCDVRRVRLHCGDGDGDGDETVEVGGTQDADATHSAFVMLDDSSWSDPMREHDGFHRSLAASQHDSFASGSIAFNLYSFSDEVEHSIELIYRCGDSGTLSAHIYFNGELLGQKQLPTGNGTWRTERFRLPIRDAPAPPSADQDGAPTRRGQAISRWPGEGTLLINDTRLLAADGTENALYHVGDPMTLMMSFTAREAGAYDIIPVAVLYRADGIAVTKHIGDRTTVELQAGDEGVFRLELGPLNLGIGRHMFSVALYRTLDELHEPHIYDLIDRSYEFEVVGDRLVDSAVFRHPGQWSLR